MGNQWLMTLAGAWPAKRTTVGMDDSPLMGPETVCVGLRPGFSARRRSHDETATANSPSRKTHLAKAWRLYNALLAVVNRPSKGAARRRVGEGVAGRGPDDVVGNTTQALEEPLDLSNRSQQINTGPSTKHNKRERLGLLRRAP